MMTLASVLCSAAVTILLLPCFQNFPPVIIIVYNSSFYHRFTDIQPYSAIPNTAAQIIQSGHLPVPTTDAGFILEIEKALRTMARVPKTRESICSYILEHKYIYQLRDSFEMAESGENLDALYALCSCMQTIRKSFGIYGSELFNLR